MFTKTSVCYCRLPYSHLISQTVHENQRLCPVFVNCINVVLRDASRSGRYDSDMISEISVNKGMFASRACLEPHTSKTPDVCSVILSNT